MANRSVSITEVLFPKVRARVLEAMFMKPHRQRYVRELVGVCSLSLLTVQDELRKISALGIVLAASRREEARRLTRAGAALRGVVASATMT